jgi:cytochrome c-type biogenesis protein CcmH/NrfF
MKTIQNICGFLITLLLFMSFNISLADVELTEAQKKLQADIEHSLIAPCCWNMTVDQHESPAARQVREQVTKLILQGKNKQEILTYFVSQPQYGERILATPAQDNLLGKLAYWLIPVAFLVGFVAIYATVKRLSRKPKTGDETQGPQTSETAVSQSEPLPEAQEPDDFWQKKVENELSEFD